MQNAGRMLMCLLLILMVLLSAVAAEAEFFFGFQPVVTYEGRRYEARPSGETTTILMIGYDHNSEGQLEELHGYSSGGQADFLLLVVLDHRDSCIRMLQIDRDTMTPVYVTDSKGFQRLRSGLQICLSHAYGDTREKNNANTVKAVETLLGIEAPDDGAQIDWYVAMDISGISRLNDLLGGVTVTLTEDMSALDPAMTRGATLRLSGRQAEIFCRSRSGVGDQTNASRMARQRQYMSAAGDTLIKMIRRDVSAAEKLLDGMGMIYDSTTKAASPFDFSQPSAGSAVGDAQGRWLMTNALQKTIVNDLGRAVDYDLSDTETLPGVHVLATNGYMTFEVEEGAAREWALSVFYNTGSEP